MEIEKSHSKMSSCTSADHVLDDAQFHKFVVNAT